MLGPVHTKPARQHSEGVDTSVRCPTAGQRYAAKALRESIDQRQPLVVVFGDSGSGKTALISDVLNAMGTEEFAVLIFSATSGEFSSPPNFDNILEAMCLHLGAPQPTNQRPETLAKLASIANKLVYKGQTLLLALDHADHLTADVIAEVVQLGEYLNIPPSRLVRIFVGSMALASRIDSVLRQTGVDDRLSEIRLSQPTDNEVAALLAYEDGAHPGGPMLTSGAIERVSAYAKSNLHWAAPMADAARALAESEGKTEVTAETVRSALLEIWSPEQTLTAESAMPSAQYDLGTAAPASDGLAAPTGMSESVGRFAAFDVPESTTPEDPLTPDDAIAASPSRWRQLAQRYTPIIVVLLFIIAAIHLSLKDVVMHEEFERLTPTATEGQHSEPPKALGTNAEHAPRPESLHSPGNNSEEARRPEPVQSPKIIAEEPLRPEQTEPASNVAPSGSPQNPSDAADNAEPQDLLRSDPSTTVGGAGSEPEQYGPWPQASNGSQEGEHPATVPQEGSIASPQETRSDEPARKTKSPPRRKKSVLKPPERRPDDLTPERWIQER